MIKLFYMCYAVSPSLGGSVIMTGSLPMAGGILDQDNVTMEAFGSIKNEIIKMSGEKNK